MRSTADLPSLVDSVGGLESDYLVGKMGARLMSCEFTVLELKKSIGK